MTAATTSPGLLVLALIAAVICAWIAARLYCRRWSKPLEYPHEHRCRVTKESEGWRVYCYSCEVASWIRGEGWQPYMFEKAELHCRTGRWF